MLEDFERELERLKQKKRIIRHRGGEIDDLDWHASDPCDNNNNKNDNENEDGRMIWVPQKTTKHGSTVRREKSKNKMGNFK